jgi:hypothetical protein
MFKLSNTQFMFVLIGIIIIALLANTASLVEGFEGTLSSNTNISELQDYSNNFYLDQNCASTLVYLDISQDIIEYKDISTSITDVSGVVNELVTNNYVGIALDKNKYFNISGNIADASIKLYCGPQSDLNPGLAVLNKYYESQYTTGLEYMETSSTEASTSTPSSGDSVTATNNSNSIIGSSIGSNNLNFNENIRQNIGSVNTNGVNPNQVYYTLPNGQLVPNNNINNNGQSTFNNNVLYTNNGVPITLPQGIPLTNVTSYPYNNNFLNTVETGFNNLFNNPFTNGLNQLNPFGLFDKNQPSSIFTTADGRTGLATTDNTINGIPASRIPPGQEDLYTLRSNVVPPVCPKCPPVYMNNNELEKKCPPCPPCARCPESSFECEKVPSYNMGPQNNYLPRPVLDDFSTFGS